MGRRPIHELAASRIPAGHDGLWQLIRRMKRFSIVELQEETGHRKDTVRDYVMRLCRAGYLKQVGTRSVNPSTVTKLYALVRDTGNETPRLKRDGSPCLQGRPREQMWRTMKTLKIFTRRELAIAASTEEQAVAEGDVATYVHYLTKAGYLAVIDPGKPGTQATYQFLESTGPKPPMIQRVKQVFDPNLQAVVWPGSNTLLNISKVRR